MTELFEKQSQTAGLPPGTLIHVGEKHHKKTRITVIDYDSHNLEEKQLNSIEESFAFRDKPSITWINIDGLEDLSVIEKIDDHFGIHPLVLEDIVNTTQRPKVDDYEDYLFIVAKMIYFDEKNKDLIDEQVSFILGSNSVISFQEKQGDVFDFIRERLRANKGRVRKLGSDYLVYLLLDALVDHYFLVLEKLGDKIELLEDRILEKPDVHTPQEIHQLKRKIIFLRKQIWPMREVLSNLQRKDSKLIKKTSFVYLRDVYDHTIQVIDTIESFRDMLSGLHDIYLSTISNKMNEIMKVLTIFAAIFIPLTFIAGIYGMNFEFMPELKWPFGYAYALGLMLVVALSLLTYFKRNKWI
ncbi:MAG: magnesium/cobalt transporter CorA [Candidatus Omnitrophica bacterium]|nr:magnesium/cobalt transporter CorA [Candidatus Omnitrophota bacterium]